MTRSAKLLAMTHVFRSERIVLPWEEIVGLCKTYGALSLVDAAHAIGQIKVDVKRADCDFWVAVSHDNPLASNGIALTLVELSQVALRVCAIL